MKIGVLTSSRSEFGIYRNLLRKIKADKYFELEIIVFGTHLSQFHGNTIDEILNEDFSVIHKINSLLLTDDPESIGISYGLTVIKFAEFWKDNKFDIVLCFGDRYEMNAAVNAGIPFNVNFAHIGGGEITEGAIDNIYRNQITLASKHHFVPTSQSKLICNRMLGKNNNVNVVGSLGLEDILSMNIIAEQEFRNKYKINNPYVLCTFHPETLNPERNIEYSNIIYDSLLAISKSLDIVITLPNNDTNSNIIRDKIYKIKNILNEKLIIIDNFGRDNYYAALKYCTLVLGNSSSGIYESASFKKYNINIGDRQKGRLHSENTINVPYNTEDILNIFNQILKNPHYHGDNIYFKEGASSIIISKLKKI